jgi:hypothetical protein
MTTSGRCRSSLAMTPGQVARQGRVSDDIGDEHRIARRSPDPKGRQAAEAATPPVEVGHSGGVRVKAPRQLDQTGEVPGRRREDAYGATARQDFHGVRVEQTLGVRRGLGARARIVVVDEPDGARGPTPCTLRPPPAFTAWTQARRPASTCRPCIAYLPDTETLAPNLMAPGTARSRLRRDYRCPGSW